MLSAEPESYAVRVGPFLRYTALRLLVLVVVGAALWFAGLRGLLWALVMVAVAAGVSYVLLTKPREALLDRLARGRPARTVDEDLDEDAAAEDAAVNAGAAVRVDRGLDQLPEMRERTTRAVDVPASQDSARHGPAELAGDQEQHRPEDPATHDGHRGGADRGAGRDEGSAEREADAEGHRQDQL